MDEVALGREPERGGRGAQRRLPIDVSDALMSREHARLRRTDVGWLMEDLDSLNGSRVNGHPVKRHVLSDGDVLTLGSTCLIFRASMPEPELAPPDRALAGLDTLLPPLQEGYAQLSQVAPTLLEVVLRGESGTGKELAARALHSLSGRPGPFVAVNCGALSPALVESELFGHRPGAFTGAQEERLGLVRSAAKGTLLLDEIGDLPLQAQAALLRVLQEREVVPVGADRPIAIDVRVVAATHRDLRALAAEGRFRADLLARLSGLTLELPPLRRRREDLGLIIAPLLRRIAPARADRCRFDADAALALFLYGWPLNIRELEKGLALALARAGEGPVELEHLPEPVSAALHQEPQPPAASATRSRPPRRSGLRPDAPLSPAEQKHREELIALLQIHRGNIAEVARALHTRRMQIHRWLKRYEIDVNSYRS